MIILFTGHRNRVAPEMALSNILETYPGATWLHGGSEGFDAQVSAFARSHGVQELVMRPDYANLPPRTAPIVRNKEMVKRADVVIALFDGRSSGGTAFTVRHAIDMGKIVQIILPQPSSSEFS